MDLLQTVLQAQGGQMVGQIARQFGLNQAQAGGALQQLIPLLGGALKRNMGQAGGMDALLGALQRGNHGRYLEDASNLERPETTLDGNAILGHLLGGKDGSRQVATHVANNTGIDGSVLKKMLPIVASMVMGAMSKQAVGGGLGNQLGGGAAAGAQSPLGGLLNSFLDQNKDGSIVDDVLGMLFKR
jgi:hypothetical protein